MATKENQLYTLIPLEEFKALAGVDDREDKLARFCLVTSTFTIEQFCKRRLLAKKHTEFHEFTGGDCLFLREYPVNKIHAVYVKEQRTMNSEQRLLSGGGGGPIGLRDLNDERVLAPGLFRAVPDCGCDEDIPFYLKLCPSLTYSRLFSGFRVVYRAGYPAGSVPADLASACLELAAWNMNRYRGRRVGMTGNYKTEHPEMSMPSNVRGLLEPYRRKVL